MGGSSNQKSWIIVSIIYGIIAAALFLLCFAKTKERVTVSMEQKENISFIQGLKLILKNNYWLILVGIWVSMAFGLSLSGAVGTYYAKYILENENLAGFLSAVAIIPVIVLMPLMAPLSAKFGKRNVALVGSFVSLGAQLLMLVNPTSATWLIVLKAWAMPLSLLQYLPWLQILLNTDSGKTVYVLKECFIPAQPLAQRSAPVLPVHWLLEF